MNKNYPFTLKLEPLGKPLLYYIFSNNKITGTGKPGQRIETKQFKNTDLKESRYDAIKYYIERIGKQKFNSLMLVSLVEYYSKNVNFEFAILGETSQATKRNLEKEKSIFESVFTESERQINFQDKGRLFYCESRCPGIDKANISKENCSLPFDRCYIGKHYR